MATIGLDMLHYAKITEDENGNESYGTPQKLAKAMSADLSVELAEPRCTRTMAQQKSSKSSRAAPSPWV